MFTKLFVLGRPGSGKTTASYRIKERAEERGWSVNRVRDYKILQNMFQNENENERKKFRSTEHNGFDVVDFSVLDTALLEVERLVKLYMLTRKEKTLAIIEFARDDYKTALEIFSPHFLHDTHILFVDANIDLCIQRIYKRVLHVDEPDNHFISETIMKEYYGKDNREYMRYLADLNAQAIKDKKEIAHVVHYIENIDSLDYLYANVDQFFNEMMKQSTFSIPPHKIPYITRTIDGVRGAK